MGQTEFLSNISPTINVSESVNTIGEWNFYFTKCSNGSSV